MTYCVSLVYISDCYEDDILLAHYHKVFRPAINHACTAPKLPLSNYSPRELGWKPVAQITVHVASHLARMIIISHRRDRKINRSSSDDGENSRDCPRQDWQSGAVTDTFVVGFRNVALAGLSWNCQFNNHFGFKSIFFDARHSHPPGDFPISQNGTQTVWFIIVS